MPLYEYQCAQCGTRFERIQKFSDPPVDTCPKCGGKVEKLLSSPAFQFKGSGFYVTDYSRKGEAAKHEAAEGKSESNEAKPAAKDAGGTADSAKGSGGGEAKPPAPSSSGPSKD